MKALFIILTLSKMIQMHDNDEPFKQNVYRADNIDEFCKKLTKKVSKIECKKGKEQLINRVKESVVSSVRIKQTDSLKIPN